MLDRQTWSLVERLWNYHRMRHELKKSDAILVLCSYDTIVAERGAQLYLEGWAPLLIFAGGQGAITSRLWREPEAEIFARIAVRMGVPAEHILKETRSTNTGENVRHTRQLLAERGLDPQSFIVVQKPYMERRSYATFKQNWPGKDIVVTSPQLSLDEYLSRHSHEALPLEDIISIMVGDLQRIKVYPAKGFQIHQEIPDEVWSAYEQLVAAGFDKHLVQS
jgi:uncharacterized SAM-binding protein YcdF (DUF218 family)